MDEKSGAYGFIPENITKRHSHWKSNFISSNACVIYTLLWLREFDTFREMNKREKLGESNQWRGETKYLA